MTVHVSPCWSMIVHYCHFRKIATVSNFRLVWFLVWNFYRTVSISLTLSFDPTSRKCSKLKINDLPDTNEVPVCHQRSVQFWISLRSNFQFVIPDFATICWLKLKCNYEANIDICSSLWPGTEAGTSALAGHSRGTRPWEGWSSWTGCWGTLPPPGEMNKTPTCKTTRKSAFWG